MKTSIVRSTSLLKFVSSSSVQTSNSLDRSWMFMRMQRVDSVVPELTDTRRGFSRDETQSISVSICLTQSHGPDTNTKNTWNPCHTSMKFWTWSCCNLWTTLEQCIICNECDWLITVTTDGLEIYLIAKEAFEDMDNDTWLRLHCIENKIYLSKQWDSYKCLTRPSPPK